MDLFSATSSLLGEVWASIFRNKLRVALTGFSVAFGILMLIILLAAGNGLLNGVMYNFKSQSHNTMTIYGGRTRKAWNGHARWRRIYLERDEWDAMAERHADHIDQCLPCISHSVTVGSGKTSRSMDLYGYVPEYINTSGISIEYGRWINDLDMAQRRKVAVMEAQSVQAIFPGQEPSECVGRWIKVDALAFQLVGIYKQSDKHSQEQNVYAPYSTLATIYSNSETALSSVRLSLKGLETAEDNAIFEQNMRRDYARIKDYDPTDYGIWVDNTAEDYMQTIKIFTGLRLLIWIIGIASLVAGVVGISNIMLITVKERTREFGIRKAIGARPRSIVELVLVESVAITLLFGYIGMLTGIGIIHLVADALSQGGSSDSFTIFRDPSVDLGVVMGATAVMVVAGLIAGYVPAQRAVRIKPVEALAS